MNKFLLSLFCVLFCGVAAHATTVRVTGEQDKFLINIKNAGEQQAAFQTGNQLWLVFSEQSMPNLIVESASVADQEILEVEKGSGLRLTLNKMPTLKAVKTEDGIDLVVGKPQKQGRLSIISLKDQIIFGGRDTGNIHRVESKKTNQIYQVMTTYDGANWGAATQINGRLLPPTLAGMWIVPLTAGLKQLPVVIEPKVAGVSLPKRVEESVRKKVEVKVIPKPTPQPVGAKEIAEIARSLSPTVVPAEKTAAVSRTEVPWHKNKPADYETAIQKLLAAMVAIEKLPVPPPRDTRKDAVPVDGVFAQKSFVPSSVGTVEQPAALEESEVFLPRLGATDMPPYLEQEEHALRRIIEAKTEREKDIARLRFAQLLIIYQRPREALSVLSNMLTTEDGLPKLQSARLLYAVTLTLLDRPKEALPILQSDIEPKGHRELWLAYTLQKEKQGVKAVPLFKENMHHATSYPNYLWRKLRISEGWSLLEAEDYQKLTDKMEELILMSPDGAAPDEVKLILAYAKLKLEKFDEAERLLAEAANVQDPAVAYQAQFDFVMFLYNRNELGIEQTINHLEDLRYLWRGSNLERDVLLELGNLYLKKRDFRKSLERFKMLTSYFPNTPDLQKITTKMERIFSEVFDEYNVGAFDELGVLGMYYDFRELTPPDNQGDRLIVGIGQRLQDMGLLERAISLYSRQIQFRIKEPVLRAETGLTLAELYTLYFQAEEGLEVLNNTDAKGLPQDLVERRKVMRAKLLGLNGHFEDALKELSNLETAEAQEVRTDIAWEQEDYKTLAKILAPKFAKALPQKWDTKTKRDFLRLAFGLHALQRVDLIDDLKRLHIKGIQENGMLSYVEFFMQDLSAGPEGFVAEKDNKMSQVVMNLMEYNKFAENYNEVREDRFRKKYQRARFNRQYRPR